MSGIILFVYLRPATRLNLISRRLYNRNIRSFGGSEDSMYQEDVPQDDDMNAGVPEIVYAVDKDGRYVTVQSVGWRPKNIANSQAWEIIEEDVIAEIQLIKAGKRSPLAYHMAKNLMDAGLMSSYAGLPRWRVKRHLKSKIFKRLAPEILQRYADIFGVSVEQLHQVPDIHSLKQDDDR